MSARYGTWRVQVFLASVALACALPSCAVLSVHPAELQRGDPSATTITISGGIGFAEVWSAAFEVMGREMTLIDQDRASGSQRWRVGRAPGGKIIAVFISPSSAQAPSYRIEVLSKEPVGLGQPSLQTREPALMDDLVTALRHAQAGDT